MNNGWSNSHIISCHHILMHIEQPQSSYNVWLCCKINCLWQNYSQWINSHLEVYWAYCYILRFHSFDQHWWSLIGKNFGFPVWVVSDMFTNCLELGFSTSAVISLLEDFTIFVKWRKNTTKTRGLPSVKQPLTFYNYNDVSAENILWSGISKFEEYVLVVIIRN